MHQQVRTSPDETFDNVKAVTDALAGAGINIEGIAPDFESPHVRTVVAHHDVEAAMAALEGAGLQPELVDAFTPPVGHRPGGLKRILDNLIARGFDIQSVVVLAGQPQPKTALVSIGVDHAVSRDEWIYLGGWDEPGEMPPVEPLSPPS